MTITANQLNAGHLHQRVEVSCDSFHLSAVLVGVVAHSVSRSVVLHVSADNCTGTITVPYNADVEVGDESAAGIGWAEEVAV